MNRENARGITLLQNASKTLWDSNADHLLARDLYQRHGDGSWTPFTRDAAFQPTPASQPAQPTSGVDPHDPKTRLVDLGREPIIITDVELRTELQSKHFEMLANSGYTFNPETMAFTKLFVGQPGAPERPWEHPDWGPRIPEKKKRRLFGRG